MSIFSMISAGIGGLGLFMLGMWLMSDGLKMAAGNSLNHFLRRWTNTRLRGLFAGFFLTSLVQSSGAITVAVIGFTNAGLLSLKRAIWVIFGSNIGTTTTGWLIILIGFNFKLSTFALPFIGIGMVMKLTKGDTRIGAFGLALVGFGVLFLGIEILKETFSVLGENLSLEGHNENNIQTILLFTGLGFLITILMQSSSATLAITLTALSGGVITLLPAAAIVIGGNLGSTSTAIFSSFGTNSVAKRVTASHVIFNMITALVALVLLLPFLSFILFIQGLFSPDPSTILTLALFHTLFNVLGVLLMWPIANNLIHWLSKRFRNKQDDGDHPLYLDKSSLALPSLALHALYKEIEHIGHYALTMAKDSLSFEIRTTDMTNKDNVVKHITQSIGDYTSKLYTQNLSGQMTEKLQSILRISQYYNTISELAVLLNSEKKPTSTPLKPELQYEINKFYQQSSMLLNQTDTWNKNNTNENINNIFTKRELEYQSLKSLLLRRGAEGSLSIAKMDRIMTSLSRIRRINQQAVKAFSHIQDLDLNDQENNEFVDKTITV